MKLTRLKGGHLEATHLAAADDGSSLDKRALLVYTGTFNSMDGEVTVTAEMLQRLATNHNARMALARNEGDFVPRLLPPLQLDHSTSATVTIGRVLPVDLELAPVVIDGTERLGLFGACRFLGAENAEKARDGRWCHLSVGADFDAGVLTELTVTPFPAAAKASLLTNGAIRMNEEQLKALKKRLMDKQNLSEKDADDKLSKMSDDEKKSELAAAEDEEKKAKLAAEEDEKKKKEQDELHAANAATVTRLAAGKDKLTKLGTAAGESLTQARLAATAGNISVRLAKLQSAAKITPAERKKIDVIKLAAGSKETIEAVLSSYEARQPVIHTGQLGSVAAVDLTTVQADAKSARLAALEEETRANMTRGKTKGDKAKLATPAAAPVKLASETTQKTDKTEELALTVEKLGKMVVDIEDAAKSGNVQDLMAKCKYLRDFMHFTAEGIAMPDADQHMATLSARVEELGTRLSEYQTAVTEVLGA